jgi:hypothetical protein
MPLSSAKFFASKFLTDVETGEKDIDTPAEYLRDPRATVIASALRALDVHEVRILGSGSFGTAAVYDGRNVVKLTSDETEVMAGAVLKDVADLPHVARIYGSWFVQGDNLTVERWDGDGRERVGVLLQEKLKLATDFEARPVTEAWLAVRAEYGVHPNRLAAMPPGDAREVLYAASVALEASLRGMRLDIATHMARALAELRGVGVYAIDVHGGNIGVSRDGVFKLFDIGSSSSPAHVEAPELQGEAAEGAKGVRRRVSGTPAMVVEGVKVGEVGGGGGAAEDVIRVDHTMIEAAAKRTAGQFAHHLLGVDLEGDPARYFFERADNRRKTPDGVIVIGSPRIEFGYFTPFTVPEEERTVRGRDRIERIFVHPVLVWDPENKELVLGGGTHGLNVAGTASIWVRVNAASPDAVELRDHPDRFVKRFATLLLHEYAHVRDYIRPEDVIDPEKHRYEPGGGYDAFVAYYNSSHEVRARMSQVVYEVLTVLQHDALGPKLRHYAELQRDNPNGYLVDAALARSKTWRRGEYIWTPENKARILRTVYRALEREGLLVEQRRPRLPRTRRSMAAEGDAIPSTWYHLTDRARFKLDPKFAPSDNALAIEDRSGQPGIYLGQSVESWVNGYGYWRPFVVEIKVDPSVVNDPGVHGRYGGEIFVPASSFDKLTIERVIPIDAYAREEYGEPGWIESALGVEFDTGAPVEKTYRGYRYAGHDVRTMPADEVAKLKKQMRQAKPRGGAREDFESRADVCDDARVWYHGSPTKFDAFQVRVGAPFGGDPMAVPTFLTCELATARAHAGPNGFVYTVKPTPKRIFRGQDLFLAEWPKWWPPQPDEMSSIGARLYEDLEAGRVFDDVHGEEADDALRAIARGHYDIMETGQMKQWLLYHGYDAFVVREAPRAPVSLAVLDPSRLKIVSVETYDEAWARRREVAEAPRVDDAAPLPFALVRHGDDLVPVLLGDAGSDELVGIDVVNNRVLSFGADAIVGLVNAEPAAVWYGVRAEVQGDEMQMAAEEATQPLQSREVANEDGKPGVKKGDTILQFPGLKARKGLPFQVRPRGQRFQWTPEKPQGLTAFPEVKKVLMRQREGVPSLESIRMAAIFAGLTVHAATSEAEDTFGRVVAKYKAMHGAMPPVEEIAQIIGTHLPAARLRMYETVLPWAVLVQDAMKRGLRDRELRRHIWVDVVEDQVENIGLAKMSFAMMLMGQNVCCLDTWMLGYMFAKDPSDADDRRPTADRISGLWKWSPAKKGRETALKRYEQVEDALVKGNPFFEAGPISYAQTQWTSWQWALGIPVDHRPWLEITKEIHAQAEFPRPETPF